jgi:hypothetical protein
VRGRFWVWGLVAQGVGRFVVAGVVSSPGLLPCRCVCGSGSGDGGWGSVSDAVSAGAAWAGGVRRIPCGVCGALGAGDGVGRRPAGSGGGVGGGAYRVGGVAGGDVAAGGSAGHCAWVSGDAAGWAGADPARGAERVADSGEGVAVGGVGGVGEEWAADVVGGGASGGALGWVCDCVASAGEAACGCVGV